MLLTWIFYTYLHFETSRLLFPPLSFHLQSDLRYKQSTLISGPQVWGVVHADRKVKHSTSWVVKTHICPKKNLTGLCLFTHTHTHTHTNFTAPHRTAPHRTAPHRTAPLACHAMPENFRIVRPFVFCGGVLWSTTSADTLTSCLVCGNEIAFVWSIKIFPPWRPKGFAMQFERS